jgi:hypothetical protein
MAVYADAEQLPRYMQALFARLAENHPGAADAILASKMVIRSRCTEPDTEITINGRWRHSLLDYPSPQDSEKFYYQQRAPGLSSCPSDQRKVTL